MTEDENKKPKKEKNMTSDVTDKPVEKKPQAEKETKPKVKDASPEKKKTPSSQLTTPPPLVKPANKQAPSHKPAPTNKQTNDTPSIPSHVSHNDSSVNKPNNRSRKGGPQQKKKRWQLSK